MSGFSKELARLQALHQGLATLCMGGTRAANPSSMSLASLPDVLRSLHEVFLHAAARLSQILAAAQRMREAHMQAQAARGILFDPFAEADAQAEMDKAAQTQLPVIKPVKPSPAATGMAMPAAPAALGQTGGFGSASQLGLPAPASSASSIFGGTQAPFPSRCATLPVYGQRVKYACTAGTSTFGSAGARSTAVKAKRR